MVKLESKKCRACNNVKEMPVFRYWCNECFKEALGYYQDKRVKQRIKCFSCGKKTVQQNPIKYQQSFYCQNCDIMWEVSKRESALYQ